MALVSWCPAFAATLCATVVLGAAEPAGAVRIVEFPLTIDSSVPLGIAAGPDGNMWFTEVNGSRIGRIQPNGTITDWSTGSGISTDSRPWGIAAGPDGNLWFSEEVGRVGRITTAATATEFSAGISPASGPRGLTGGPDGNVWFTEDAGRIGRITPTGTVTEFSAGITPGSRPLSIASGPDGNLWFTAQLDRIGRITPAGVVTEFTAGIAQGARPSDIAAGPDGNLWFTEADLARIARITPAGVVTEFTAGITPRSQPRGITAGPDGNLWFTEEVGSRIGRITPAGTVTEFPGPTQANFAALGIAAGPTGDLWYAGGNAIGRVSLDPVATTGDASNVGSAGATVAGAVTPFASPASFVVQYGRSTTYGSSTSPQSLDPSVSQRAVSARLGDLRPGTPYHYRVVASSVAGTAAGADRTFTTAAGAPGSGGPGSAPGTGGSGGQGSTDRTGPRMRVVGRRLKLDGRGRLRIVLRCPVNEPLGCRGSLRLTTVPRRGRRAVRVGAARFRIAGGQTQTVTVRVTARGRALTRRARLPARLEVTAQDAVGNRGRSVTRVTVRR